MLSRNVSETNLVAYLKCKGYKEVSPPRLIDKSVVFFFEDTPKLSKEIQTYFNREGLVEPLSMQEAFGLLRSIIRDTKENQRGGE